MRSAAARVRAAPARAWRGTARTAGWVRGGVGRGLGRATGGIRAAATGGRDRISAWSERAWDRSGGARLAHGARSNPRVAIAWAAAAILILAWIGWTAYVTAEHGSNAGIGVLISWPVALAAVAIVAAPFVGAWLLVRRLRPREGDPAIAGGAEVPEPGTESEQTTSGTHPG